MPYSGRSLLIKLAADTVWKTMVDAEVELEHQLDEITSSTTGIHGDDEPIGDNDKQIKRLEAKIEHMKCSRSLVLGLVKVVETARALDANMGKEEYASLSRDSKCSLLQITELLNDMGVTP
ncbi:hypothetical protein [uncultured Mediterranean phage]|nr:hypothetical protein [uncultured Mediterranean phage]